MQSQRRLQSQPQSERQYYTTITQFPDPDRLAKLLELGSPSLFDGGSTSNFVKNDRLPKLNSASITTKSDDRLSKLLELGDPNFFGRGR
jgi:hypothetical protein